LPATVLTTTPAYQLSFIAGEPFGSGAGPQCLVEDPSDQFIYSADFNDSSVTGRVVDPNSGVLNNLRATAPTRFRARPPGAWLTGVPAKLGGAALLVALER
jgi:hypothetical protein